MDPINPYKVPAGSDLDRAIHTLLFEEDLEASDCPNYSDDAELARKVVAKLKSRFGESIITGRTRISKKPWFAPYDKDPSTATEVVAETPSLAICRLALLRVMRDSD